MTMIEKSRSETEMTDYAKDIQQTKKKWYRVHKMTVSARRVLVHEIVSLFEFKPGIVEDRSAEAERGQHNSPSISPSTMATAMPFAAIKDKNQHSEDLYICGVTLPARTIDVSKYSKEELNASIGLLIHILGLIVRYLGIKLPNPIFYKSVHPYVRYNSDRQRHSTKIPLFLDDKNFRRFTIGMAMLNYNIAYLCYTQGVEIPLSQVTNALQALMECCRSPRIGIRSHVTIYQGIPSISDFPLEFHQVLRMTALRYRSGLSSELSKELVFYDLFNNGGFDSTSKLGLADDWYFYDGLLDNDEEDDIQDDEVVDDQVDESTSERWNLVDVMPSFGRPNGESESIFQLGATMMGMMESLGGRTVMGSIAGSTTEPTVSASPSSSQCLSPVSQRRQDYYTRQGLFRRYM
ncbi:hypothetical protein K492DRAFT_183680 [Lichtheimia hyalospora FSU 10163]|nr:hypothetical protein K492DRAFT_183680 [Lichtheimia hyalospora FSU 10163]